LACYSLLFSVVVPAGADKPKPPQDKADAVDTTNDPLESVNRTIFDVNDFLDRLLLRPLAELYRAIIPPPVRDRVTNILSDMKEPVMIANNRMLREFTWSGGTAERRGPN